MATSMTPEDQIHFVQITFPRFAPGGREGRWVTPAVSAARRSALVYAAGVYRRTRAPDGERATDVRVVGDAELRSSEGDLAVGQAYRDLRWFAEREANVELFGGGRRA
jgi:hypothetical protein